MKEVDERNTFFREFKIRLGVDKASRIIKMQMLGQKSRVKDGVQGIFTLVLQQF
ncbi:hypothetical protein [Trichodesmium erythraeum]|uniref:hypothetical protein n=1 Tax=Trichodesmium erythraeum TaxID=1206 RepID=UPI0002F8773A|nr:hypothetical protein [Trichodesmium erythraeum 21-75]